MTQVVALAVTLTFVVALLSILVVGLLRSHADILLSLHDLGGGVGDPSERAGDATAPAWSPVTIGPSLPGERNVSSTPPVAGVTPAGDAFALRTTGVDHFTLLAFLSSGCATCQGFWHTFRSPETFGLPDDVRLLVVTKGPEFEIASEVHGKAGPNLRVVMSTEAWSDYEVPGSPFFVLVDGRTGRRIGEGVAHHFPQVADLVRRAMADSSGPSTGYRVDGARPAGTIGRLDGPAREAANDAELMRAGILPGDPSLYPRSLEDVFRAPPIVPTGPHTIVSETGPARRR